MTDLGVPFGKASWRTFWRIGAGLRPGLGGASDEIVRFPSNLKTAIRSLEERYAQVRLLGRPNLAKLLLANEKARKGIT